jgi:hypothetical protein
MLKDSTVLWNNLVRILSLQLSIREKVLGVDIHKAGRIVTAVDIIVDVNTREGDDYVILRDTLDLRSKVSVKADVNRYNSIQERIENIESRVDLVDLAQAMNHANMIDRHDGVGPADESGDHNVARQHIVTNARHLFIVE